MKLKTKKIIAKEILYFFLCIAVSLLFFGGTFGYNWIRKSLVKNVEKDIIKETALVDSLLSKDNDFSKILNDYVFKWNTGKYENQEELNASFPKIELFDGRYNQALADYVATWNSGKYKTQEELNCKFPEFFNVLDSIDEVNLKRTFKVNDDIYDIPFDKSNEFLVSFPNAIEMKSFILRNDTFNVEFYKISDFISENPDAKPIYVFTRNDSIRIFKENISILKTKKMSYEHKILSFDEQTRICLFVFIVLLILIYPIRMIYYLIKWSLKIVKEK